MSTVAGLLGLHALVLALGFAFLHATGVVALGARTAVAAAGLAHLTGVAVLCLAAVLVLVAGGSLSAPVVVVVVVILCAALIVVARLWAPGDPAVAPLTARRRDLPGLLLGGAVAAFVVLQIARSFDLPTAWDAAHNWTLKAALLFHEGNLDSAVFRGPDLFVGTHQGYPILHPALGGIVFEFAGEINQGLLVAELWLLTGALVSACVFLLRRAASSALVLAPLGLAIASGTTAGLVRGDADVTMAVFLAAGSLCLALWLESGSRAFLPLGAVLLGAAANTKNEGLLFAVIVLAVAALLSIPRSSRDRIAIAVAGAAVAATALPWRVWVSANGPFPSDVRPLGEALDPGLLADSLDQLNMGARAILFQMLDDTGSAWLVPALLVLAGVAVILGRDRRGLAFYLGSVIGVVGALLWVYWTSPQPDVADHIARTALRTVTGPVFLAGAGLAFAFSGIRLQATRGEP